MDLDRPHHRTNITTTTTTSELFICFTSRLSSSSMRLSKSILSPSHARDTPLSLSTSLSRRLKTNGSIKGGQSPMFPCNNKKRGSSFENPEPSSPKVTCIGQVKMKTKKKVKQTRSLSKRRGDGSFRKIEQAPADVLNQRSLSVHFQPPQECAAHRNQRWVHLPLTIYETLREFSCLLPCRSSCFSTNEKEKEEKINGSKCVFARWLVALQNGEAEKNREIEFVVANNGEEEERIGEMKSRMRSSRRHVFEDIEFKDIESSVEMKELGEPEEEEKARVSICVPPKNALLLMRCRSDPMKMADLTNKFWESPARKETNEKEEENKEENGGNEQVEKVLVDAEKCEWNNELQVIDKRCEEPEETSDSVDLVENEEISESVEIKEMEIESSKDEEKLKSSELEPETEQEDEEESEIKPLIAEVNSIEQVPESSVDQATENVEDNKIPEPEKEEEEEGSSSQSYSSFSENSSESREDTSKATEEEDETFNSNINKEMEETLLSGHVDEDAKQEEEEEEEEAAKSDDVEVAGTEKNEVKKGDIIKSVLPDCLLMMMYEPKLSMEVSKETWVHSTDFILPEREKQAKSVKKRFSIDSKPPHPAQDNRSDQHLLIPPRSSCCLPAVGVPAMSMATMIEQKLVNAVAYEPFVLTRCKSEPMRMAAAAKLAPESCFWKNRKFEPHRPATYGVGF
ncbi:PREDICTED: titin homolog [Nicotiana attenuata]|uniref:Uncharacterized protein n=1 Tax=Nicotiana attenuata TaxID=49451 RepID=A0A1J6J3A0_NICAT|nr:PREDICTED: titin homolog [Nicotiana attenuata]OIT01785.1 hypothetical protein A4A49_14547 [Nicotiana attenuata]